MLPAIRPNCAEVECTSLYFEQTCSNVLKTPVMRKCVRGRSIKRRRRQRRRRRRRRGGGKGKDVNII
jgi:hypothetical protein